MIGSGADDLIAMLLAHAARRAAAPALTAPGRTAMTFGELASRIGAIGARLAGWGIGRGDIVAWPMIDRADGAAALAIMPVASTLAPLAPGLTAHAYEALLRRLGPKAVATRAGTDHAIVEAARRLAIAEIAIVPDPQGAAGAFDLQLTRAQASLSAATLLSPQIAYVSATSGTTGRSKLVPHGHGQIVATARLMVERLAVGPGDVSGHVSPMHLANGMRTGHLLALLGGGAVACLPESDPDTFLAAVARGEITYTSASFTILREILLRCESGGRVERGRLRFLRIASGRLEVDEIDRLEAAIGVPVVTGLASTETGIISHQRLPPAPRSRGSVGLPLGCEIRLADAEGRVVAPGDSGEIQVRGPQVFAGYIEDPALNARAFVDGWFRMGDLGRLDAAGEIHLVGRITEIVNRGGDKISPAEVDAALRAVPGVADAASFGIPHPRLGEELVAAIVRAPSSALLAESVTAHVRALLGGRRTPRRLWFVDALPRNDSGKLLRNALAEWVGHHATAVDVGAEHRSDRPRSPLEIALTGLWASVLGRASVAPDDDFFMLGGDSLRGAQLVDQVRVVFGVDLPGNALYDDAGTVAAMAARIASARTPSARRVRTATIPRRPAGAPVPPSSTQARAWFLQRLDPDSTAYHEARLWRIDGPLDIGALHAALAFVAARQPMLRTRFVVVDGEPRQAIDAAPAVKLEVIDLRAAGDDGDRRLADAVREQVTRPFDLAAAPPLRWTLFELGPGRHALLRTWHHILGDALSARVLQQEVAAAYAAALAGGDPALPELPIDYADYAIWQAREEGGAEIANALTFWKAQLADLPVLALPADFRRPPAQSFVGGSLTTRLPRAEAAALEAFGRSRGATPFVTFLAAFSALLSRLSGDEDLAIGTPVAGRPLPELAGLIGFFANTLVFRADLTGTPTVEELLARTKQRVRDALLHQQVPFGKLVDALGAPRDASRNPLFQVAFAMREHDAVDLRFEGAQVCRADTGAERAKFDLTVTLIEGADGIEARWEYCADLFTRATIERMGGQYAQLVAAMAQTPDAPVATLPLMDETTRDRIVAAAQGTTPPCPVTATIAQRFAEQARARPAAIAIAALDYAGLDAAANRLAQALCAAGVVRGAIVAVARRSSADIAIAWLAVLKAGAAYLPIDADLPAERIAFMLADARVAHAIADDAPAALLARPGVHVIRPERDGGRIAAHAADAPEIAARPDDPAYVIYTSGSTGSPKGVVVPHRAVLRLVCGTDCAQLGPDDAVAQMANPAFDASTFEFWGALLNGARIVPIAKSIAIAPRALAAAIANEGVTALFLTTAVFHAVAREVPTAFGACRCVLFGGEAVEPRWAAAVLESGPPRQLLHVYGPTETATFATWQEVRHVAPNAATIPIGRPLANTEVFVLRPDFEPAAPGEPGEICIGGPGVALGYLNASAQQAARFVVRAVAGLPARRLYRTGDRARIAADGTIEFLGRGDRQVKIRGHRIELEEIEAVIARLPQVRAAAVAVRGDSAETRQLVAYVVAADPMGPPPSNLWSALRPLLPEYMLPASILWLPALPLNASGKVDRRALPAGGLHGAVRSGVRVAPRDMFEQVLARIWEDLLRAGEIGVLDHFFEIGGHSLLAARLFDEIERETGLTAPLAALFADDTIAGLARALRERPSGLDAPVVAINDGGSLPPLVFLHGDLTGGGFYSRSLAHALGPDQPVLVVQPHGLSGTAIPDTIEAMAADRLCAVRAIRPRGPYLVGGYCNGALVAFEMARQLIAAGDEVPAVIVIEARAPRGGGQDAVGDTYVTFERGGGFRVLAASDRASDVQLRYSQAMGRYAGGPLPRRLILVRSVKLDDARRDLGWARFVASAELHVLPGDHVTLVTRHVRALAQVVRAAIDRVLERALP